MTNDLAKYKSIKMGKNMQAMILNKSFSQRELNNNF